MTVGGGGWRLGERAAMAGMLVVRSLRAATTQRRCRHRPNRHRPNDDLEAPGLEPGAFAIANVRLPVMNPSLVTGGEATTVCSGMVTEPSALFGEIT